MEKSKIKIIVLIVVFAVLGGVMLYQLLPASKAPTARKTDEAGSSYEEQLVRAERMVELLPAQKILADDLQKKLKAYDKEVPPESDHTWLSRIINSAARDIGVQELSQKYRPTETADRKLAPELEKQYAEKMWEIRMQCGYHDLGKFLSSLEGSNRFLEIADINVEGNEPGKQKTTLLIRYIARK